MNLNVWKKLLSADEMKQMTKKTSDSFKCGPIVVQEPNLILRWRDLLHYSSSGLSTLLRVNSNMSNIKISLNWYNYMMNSGINLKLNNYGDLASIRLQILSLMTQNRSLSYLLAQTAK